MLAQYLVSPRVPHLAAAKRVLQYLKQTISLDMIFDPRKPLDSIEVFCDADFAADIDDRRCHSGYVCFAAGVAVDWSSGKQRGTATSSCDAEVVSFSQGYNHSLFCRNFLEEVLDKPIVTHSYEDNNGAIDWFEGKGSKRMKHMEIKAFHVRGLVTDGLVKITKVPTNEMIADAMTKPLPFPLFMQHTLFMLGHSAVLRGSVKETTSTSD